MFNLSLLSAGRDPAAHADNGTSKDRDRDVIKSTGLDMYVIDEDERFLWTPADVQVKKDPASWEWDRFNGCRTY